MGDQITSQIASTDPALTAALGLPENQIGESDIVKRIAPEVEVYNRNFKARLFGKDRFKKQVKVSRPRGGDAERVVRTLKDPKAFSVDEKTLKDVMDRRDIDEARNAPDGGFDLRLQTSLDTSGQLHTTIEAGVAGLFMAAGTYGAGNKSATAVDVFAETNGANLKSSVRTAQRQIMKTWAVRPATMIFTPDAFDDVCTKNASIKDQFKYTDSKSITEEMLAQYLQLDEVIVPQTVWFDDAEAGDFIWSGKKALLLYVNPKPGLNGPCFAKTFFRMIDGNREVVRTAFDMPGNEHFYIAREEETAIVFSDAAYLWY